MSPGTEPRIALYTAVMGQYEQPSENMVVVPSPSASGHVADCYRFSDTPVENLNRPDNDTGGWIHVYESPRIPGDPSRSTRALKILGHDFLTDHDVTVWIDNRIRLKVSPEELVSRLLPDSADMAVAFHSFRSCLRDEFREVEGAPYDDTRRIREQRFVYETLAPQLLSQRVYWGGMLIRRNNPAVAAFSRFWWEQVLRFSRRDQLSFPFSCHSNPQVTVEGLELDIFESEFHEWRAPSEVGRQPGADLWRPASVTTEILDSARFLKQGIKRHLITSKNVRRNRK